MSTKSTKATKEPSTIGFLGGIDVERARASLDQGVLEASIPKTQVAAKKSIGIQ